MTEIAVSYYDIVETDYKPSGIPYCLWMILHLKEQRFPLRKQVVRRLYLPKSWKLTL